MKINKIFLHEDFSTQSEVFLFLGEEMKQLHVVSDSKDYVTAVESRETQGTTGLVDGFAIPHGKSNAIEQAAIIYIRNNNGIEWNSLDGSLVTDIFALAIPESATNEHLDTLIALSTKLMDSSICERLRQTQLETDVLAIFES